VFDQGQQVRVRAPGVPEFARVPFAMPGLEDDDIFCRPAASDRGLAGTVSSRTLVLARDSVQFLGVAALR
jgi:hypothetical protein